MAVRFIKESDLSREDFTHGKRKEKGREILSELSSVRLVEFHYVSTNLNSTSRHHNVDDLVYSVDMSNILILHIGML